MAESFPIGRPHLVPYDLRRLPSLSCGVLVVGSGIAGCCATLTAAGETDVIQLAKGNLSYTNTSLAQGGIASSILPEDGPEAHGEDTLRTGNGLCEEEVVRLTCREARRTVGILAKWGVDFDLDSEGQLDLHREGGHSGRRVLHVEGDATGRAIQKALAARVSSHPEVTCLPVCFVLELLVEEGICRGALVSSASRGILVIWAEQVILASGGGGQIFRETTNLARSTGDGLTLGFKAGAALRDLEFVQFHPTALYMAGAGRFLISEAVRGAGAVIRDREGNRVMEGVHPREDLAPRDVVSRQVFRRMVETSETHLLLDLREIEGDVRIRFPGIAAVCSSFGIDIRRDLVPIRPAAHYFIGGLRVDAWGRTDVPNLLAAGEVSCSGLHGANRLASNSLLEGAFFGCRAGQAAAGAVGGQTRPFARRVSLDLREKGPAGTELNVYDMLYSLKATMDRQAGIERERQGLEEAAEAIDFWGRCLADRALQRPRAWELANMLSLSGLLCRAALWRRESRGVHMRRDHPERKDREFRCHSLLRMDPEEGLARVGGEPLGGGKGAR